MNLDHLKYLVTVADCESIHEASRQLLLKQQYISNVIKSLERYFDVQIFERTSKGVTPTINGQYLIDKARTILTTYEERKTHTLSRQSKVIRLQRIHHLVYTSLSG